MGKWRKSSRSNSTGGDCVEARSTTPWRKSSRSNSAGGECVEARTLTGHFQVRDSKLGDSSPIFNLTGDDWQGFLSHVRR